MTLEKMLRQQLSNPKPGGFHFSFGGWNVTLIADKCDSLSCALKELTLERNTPIQEELKPWAQRIAQRATGLIEPLSLSEADLLLGKAILRSQTPTVRGSTANYYELVLERTGRPCANLHRYSANRQNGEKRKAVPFVLTHDAIVKLVTDIVGSN